MLFTEPAFLFVFLPALLGIHALTPKRGRNLVLTLASLLFYAVGEMAFLPWLLASTALNYVVALGLDRWKGSERARVLLELGIASDVLLLVAFKYGDLLIEAINVPAAYLHLGTAPLPGLVLPLGISFFTFHKISYKVDVYRGVAPVRRNPMDLLLYILLFPQLIAGPIVRYHEIAQDLVGRAIRLSDVAEGVRRFIMGMAKKMLVANTLAGAADPIFALPANELSLPLIWTGLLCYAFQIYFDFSGYSDMAIGLGRMFGFSFPENFDFPYVSRSITEFWRRWHMSLSRWFRDYLYIPLGGNRISEPRTYLNLMIVFLLCGLWHGARWTFLLWGAFHGLALTVERLSAARWLHQAPVIVGRLYTSVLLLVGWAVFRADSWTHLKVIVSTMMGRGAVLRVPHWPSEYVTVEVMLALALGLLSAVRPWALAWERRENRRLTSSPGGAMGWLAEPAILGTLLVASIARVAADTYNPFIYFRF